MKLVLATGNAGKLRELRALLASHNIEVLPQSDFGVETPEETGTTFVDNALLKARHAAQVTGHPAIADDSGLEVDALNGRPGVYSARYCGLDASDDGDGVDKNNNRKLLQELQGVPLEQRTARYRCVLVMVRDAFDANPLICEGAWEGRIGFAPKGDGGFGYDPLFIVDATGQTAAQLPAEVKNRLSHRGQALQRLATSLSRMALT